MPPTQITRALNELGIERISAHSPQAKGRVERFFHTAQDRLVKQLRLAGACMAEAANACQRFTVAPANSTDAHRPLSELHDLAASLSHGETRTVSNHYTFPFDGRCYRIKRGSIEVGMRCQQVRVERRLDGSPAVRFRGVYLDVEVCPPDEQKPKPAPASKPVRKDHNRGGRSSWMRDSLSVLPSLCGKPSANRTLTADNGAPGKPSPAIFAFTVQDLCSGTHHRDATMKKLFVAVKGLPITYGAVRRIGRRHPLRRDPARVPQHNTYIRSRRSKPDISTSLRIGHFYFAPTTYFYEESELGSSRNCPS